LRDDDAAGRSGLALRIRIAPPDKRAAVASSYFVCCIIGTALADIAFAGTVAAAGVRAGPDSGYRQVGVNPAPRN
jgi:hypothetical protein